MKCSQIALTASPDVARARFVRSPDLPSAAWRGSERAWAGEEKGRGFILHSTEGMSMCGRNLATGFLVAVATLAWTASAPAAGHGGHGGGSRGGHGGGAPGAPGPPTSPGGAVHRASGAGPGG